jgi:hypothetical protein
METFRKELTELINKHSIDTATNTPDYILADYMIKCLGAFDHAVNYKKSEETLGEPASANTDNAVTQESITTTEPMHREGKKPQTGMAMTGGRKPQGYENRR